MQTLVIDDNAFALKLLARQLDVLGHAKVTLCDSAKEAVSLLQADQERIGLVFCDLQMPDIDGVQFVRHLARIGFRGSLVLVSGEDGRILQTVEKLALAHQIDMLGTLAKPVSIDRLRHILDQRAQRHARSEPAVADQLIDPDELRMGIADGALENHYQPKVSLQNGTLVGVEALVRWRHPRLGMVPPDRFIAVAEEHELIDDLTHTVLTAALRQARVWHDDGLVLQVGVNVSMDNLAVLDFPDVVAQLAAKAQIPLAQLILEVTETRLMTDLRAALDTLTRLRLKRVGLSIDDFGTGHSSLAQLRDIPFDELKLDKGFIHGAATDASLRAIVEGTLAMARQLGITSVAEGVEDRQDWDFMRTLGCDIAQGYFIARPMTGAELPIWKAEWELRSPELLTDGP